MTWEKNINKYNREKKEETEPLVGGDETEWKNS